jgi:hypothetical protein
MSVPKGPRWYYRTFGWWGLADYLGHRCPCPMKIRLWVCDRFDRSLGLFDDELD